MTPVTIGIGSNARPRMRIARALDALETGFGTLAVSPVYRSTAVGFTGADFLNLVVRFKSAAPLDDIRARLRDIEAACGRDRTQQGTACRMDIDLLLFGDAQVTRDGLELPRRDILEHAFVLRPLSELAPDARHPVLGRTYRDLWAERAPQAPPLVAVGFDRAASIS